MFACLKCITDESLASRLGPLAVDAECDCCGDDSGDARRLAVDVDHVIEAVEEALYFEYDDPANELPWEGREGGWQGQVIDGWDMFMDYEFDEFTSSDLLMEYVAERFSDRQKTRRSVRKIPVPPEMLAAILRLRMLSDGSPYVFLTCDRLRTLERRFGAGPIMSSRILPTMNDEFKAIQRAAASAIEDDNWRIGCLHDLRKSFGTRAAAAGVPMRELQAHMGHSTITTTAEFYVDIEPSAADRLRKVFAA